MSGRKAVDIEVTSRIQRLIDTVTKAHKDFEEADRARSDASRRKAESIAALNEKGMTYRQLSELTGIPELTLRVTGGRYKRRTSGR